MNAPAVETFTTDTVSQRERLAYWNDAISSSFTGLVTEPKDGDRFHAKLGRSQLGPFIIGNPISASTFVRHTRQHVRQSTEACFLLHFQVSGRSLNCQASHKVILNPGDFTLCDSVRPYWLELSDPNEMLVLRIPDGLMRMHFPDAEVLVGKHVSGSKGTGALVGNYLTMLWRRVLKDGPDVIPAQSCMIALNLLSLAYDSDLERGGLRQRRSSVSYDRIVDIVESRLCDPGLSVAALAGIFQVTPRTLQKVFSAHGTSPRDYILSRRLETAARLLSDPAQVDRSITDICFSIGFGDLSHFGRLFMRKFGVSPRVYRKRALSSL